MKIIIDEFPNLNDKQISQFYRLKSIYKEWNSKINVISRKDIENIYSRHVLHSLVIAKFIKFKRGTTILDLGTGGGFPGIPLAILFPECKFLLVDSINKKINVVEEITKSLKLTNVSFKAIRVEKLDSKHEFIISRAVTKMNKFKKLVKGRISSENKNHIKNGILYLKGGDLKDEMKNINHKIYNISDFFEEDFFETKKIVYVEN